MGDLVARCRAAAVLVLVAASSVPVLRLAQPLLRPDRQAVDTVLLAGLSWILVGCWAWLSLTTVLVALEAITTGGIHLSQRLAPRAARSLVAAACGAGLAAGAAAPAHADPSLQDPPLVHVLDGLALPDRPTGAVEDPGPVPATRARQPMPQVVTVRSGDCLWAIARGQGTDWLSLYRANRRVVGTDPDLIQPGMRLVVPSHPTHEGER